MCLLNTDELMTVHEFHRVETWMLKHLVVPVLEVELAGQEALLSLNMVLVKPKQECSLLLGLGITLLLLSSVMSMFSCLFHIHLCIYCANQRQS